MVFSPRSRLGVQSLGWTDATFERHIKPVFTSCSGRRKLRGKEIAILDPKMDQEKERFCSRLASIPGIQPLPSPQTGDWILLQVPQPADLARKVNRRLEPGTMSVPRTISGTVRVHVADPKKNEALLKTLRDVVA